MFLITMKGKWLYSEYSAMNVKTKYFQELSFQPQTLVHSFSWLSASQTCDLCSWAWMCSYIVFEQFIWLQATVLISQELPGLPSWELWFQIQRSCVHTNTPPSLENTCTGIADFVQVSSMVFALRNWTSAVVLNFGLVLNVFVPQSEYLVEKSVLTCFIENKSVCSFTLQYNLFGFK